MNDVDSEVMDRLLERRVMGIQIFQREWMS